MAKPNGGVFMEIHDVSKNFGIDIWEIRRWIREGKLWCLKVCERRFLRIAEVKDMLAYGYVKPETKKNNHVSERNDGLIMELCEACDFYGLTPKQIKAWAAEGKIVLAEAEKKKFVKIAEIESMIAANVSGNEEQKASVSSSEEEMDCTDCEKEHPSAAPDLAEEVPEVVPDVENVYRKMTKSELSKILVLKATELLAIAQAADDPHRLIAASIEIAKMGLSMITPEVRI